jgi:tRNA (guanine-N7-)-methyltransferase
MNGATSSTPGHAQMPRILPVLFPGPVDWDAVFGRSAPLEVELGFGRPHFLFERAAEVPENNLVGIEWKGRWVNSANRRILRQGVKNVRAAHGNAWLLAGAFFAEESLSSIFLNFPDPWWKKKHHKRRIVTDAFVDALARRLKPGGLFYVHTDVASLLEQYLERLEAHPLLFNPHGGGRREKKCHADGIPTFVGVVHRAER